jgi:hypothetical protein
LGPTSDGDEAPLQPLKGGAEREEFNDVDGERKARIAAVEPSEVEVGGEDKKESEGEPEPADEGDVEVRWAATMLASMFSMTALLL